MERAEPRGGAPKDKGREVAKRAEKEAIWSASKAHLISALTLKRFELGALNLSLFFRGGVRWCVQSLSEVLRN